MFRSPLPSNDHADRDVDVNLNVDVSLRSDLESCREQVDERGTRSAQVRRVVKREDTPGMSAALTDGMPTKTEIDPITLDSVHGGFVNRFPFAAAVARPFVRGIGGNVRFWRGGNGFRGQRLFSGGGE